MKEVRSDQGDSKQKALLETLLQMTLDHKMHERFYAARDFQWVADLRRQANRLATVAERLESITQEALDAAGGTKSVLETEAPLSIEQMAMINHRDVVPVVVADTLRVAAQAPDAVPSPAPSPTPTPRRTIPGSVEAAVERYLREHGEPCTRAIAERIPCYPVTVEAYGPNYSVAESLRNWKPDLSPGVVGDPPVSPWGTPIGGVGFDPVCASKSVVKSLRGKNDTYYLYRVWDPVGEHAVLRDQPLEPGKHAGAIALQFELLGKIEGQCEAIAAWRKANREAEERNKQGRPEPE